MKLPKMVTKSRSFSGSFGVDDKRAEELMKQVAENYHNFESYIREHFQEVKDAEAKGGTRAGGEYYGTKLVTMFFEPSMQLAKDEQELTYIMFFTGQVIEQHTNPASQIMHGIVDAAAKAMMGEGVMSKMESRPIIKAD